MKITLLNLILFKFVVKGPSQNDDGCRPKDETRYVFTDYLPRNAEVYKKELSSFNSFKLRFRELESWLRTEVFWLSQTLMYTPLYIHTLTGTHGQAHTHTYMNKSLPIFRFRLINFRPRMLTYLCDPSIWVVKVRGCL